MICEHSLEDGVIFIADTQGTKLFLGSVQIEQALAEQPEVDRSDKNLVLLRYADATKLLAKTIASVFDLPSRSVRISVDWDSKKFTHLEIRH